MQLISTGRWPKNGDTQEKVLDDKKTRMLHNIIAAFGLKWILWNV
jgi:hypothetical protein